jgi:hypothetical protein
MSSSFGLAFKITLAFEAVNLIVSTSVAVGTHNGLTIIITVGRARRGGQHCCYRIRKRLYLGCEGKELSCHGILGHGLMGRRGMCLSTKSIDRDIRWSGDDEHGVTDVLNNIIKGKGVDNTCREELSSGFRFLTEPLNEGDNKGGLVTGFI